MQVREEERREVPDRFLGADLPQTAAGESAADRKRQRNPFVRDQRRDADHGADDGPGVGPRQEPSQKRSREREVGGVVIEEETGDHTGGQRHAEAGGEDEPLRPIALFCKENAAEPRKPHQHRRQYRDDRQLHHQGGEQVLLPGEELYFVRHLLESYSRAGQGRFERRGRPRIT